VFWQDAGSDARINRKAWIFEAPVFKVRVFKVRVFKTWVFKAWVFEVHIAMSQRWTRQMLEPALRRVFHLYWRFARGMTLGVRAVVLDTDNRVFLVKHSYVAGWHLPGGGVEVGETLRQALERELMEEGRIQSLGEPRLLGIFFNHHVSRRDHVAVYVINRFRQDRMPEPNHEIIACGFFAADALPPDTTGGTRLRIAEALANRPIIATWRE
jgi:ADP-ribose pyrophosphatase YjhB (NUDIX family)